MMMKKSVLVAFAVLFISCSQVRGQNEVDLNVLMYPYVPEGSAGIEQFEKEFEAFSLSKGLKVDLDLTLQDTYSNPVVALNYDIAELDLCVLDALRKDDKLPLEDISAYKRQGDMVGPAASVSNEDWAKLVVPHWVCGNFLVFRKSNKRLSNCQSFEDFLAAMHPKEGRPLFADLWGGGTLGELYADAVLDMYGAEFTTKHLKNLSSIVVEEEADSETPEQEFARWSEVVSTMNSAAVLKLYRLSEELELKIKANRKSVHNTPYIVPRAFADEQQAALLGYSERMYHVERDIQDKPWDGGSFPVDDYIVRQFSFHNKSAGTPSWVDAFVVPTKPTEHGADKKKAIKLFFEFALSQKGYESILEPRKYFPAAYLLPAYDEIVKSDFAAEKMPLLQSYATELENAYPVFDNQVYKGLDQAGEALKILLKRVN